MSEILYGMYIGYRPHRANFPINILNLLTFCTKLTDGKAQFSSSLVCVTSTVRGEKFIIASGLGGLGSIVPESGSPKQVEPPTAAPSKWGCEQIGQSPEKLGI